MNTISQLSSKCEVTAIQIKKYIELHKTPTIIKNGIVYLDSQQSDRIYDYFVNRSDDYFVGLVKALKQMNDEYEREEKNGVHI